MLRDLFQEFVATLRGLFRAVRGLTATINDGNAAFRDKAGLAQLPPELPPPPCAAVPLLPEVNPVEVADRQLARPNGRARKPAGKE